MSDVQSFTLCCAEFRENRTNIRYPLRQVVSSKDDLIKAVSRDHVCAIYEGDRRGNGRFISADVLAMDLDNDDSEAEKWLEPSDVAELLPGAQFYAVPSRNHMQQKGTKSARPRYHFYFPLSVTVERANVLAALKQRVLRRVPAFDSNALDASRFFYGVKNPTALFFEGSRCIDDIVGVPAEEAAPAEYTPMDKSSYTGGIISEGGRNNTLHLFACRVITKYGDCDKAHALFMAEADKCAPPLPENEIKGIWESAKKSYKERVLKKTDYIRIDDLQNRTSEPADYTDVGQAQKFIEAYGDRVRFTPVTGWLVFDGQVWREDSIAAQSLSQSLTKLQLSEARKRLRVAHDMKDRAAEGNSEDEKKKAKELEEKEEAFRNFVLKRRKSANIAATLVESKPPLTVDVAELDANPYMLNTPAGEINLRTGEVTKHNPTSLCTKMTAVSPGTKGKDVFENFLRQICCDDTELMAYLQECAGMFAVGKVLREKMIIATGTGGNGKSTFFGLLLRVLGDYGGMIASDVLVTTRRNKSPELAELRGKRLVVAAELEEGMRLDSAMAKKIASRDRIRGEAKYRAPFDFWPSHSTVLFTNFLPKVGSNDGGTWSRLVVVPFNATFRGTKKEILDYDGVLFRECGEAVLQWIVDGAVTFLKNEGRIAQPACVVKAIAEYREQNDWLSNFLTECCERGTAYKERSSTLYERYRQWCESEGDFVRRKDEFRAAMEKAGFEYKKTMDGAFVRGVRAVNETLRDLRDNLNSEKNTAVPAWVG